MKRQNREKAFEKAIEKFAPFLKMRYFKIPDTHMINAQNRYQNREAKRPFDGVLVTKNGNALIECKFQNNKLMPHQLANKEATDKLNRTFFVLTEKINKTKGLHYVCQHLETKHEFKDLIETLRFVENVLKLEKIEL